MEADQMVATGSKTDGWDKFNYFDILIAVYWFF